MQYKVGPFQGILQRQPFFRDAFPKIVEKQCQDDRFKHLLLFPTYENLVQDMLKKGFEVLHAKNDPLMQNKRELRLFEAFIMSDEADEYVKTFVVFNMMVRIPELVAFVRDGILDEKKQKRFDNVFKDHIYTPLNELQLCPYSKTWITRIIRDFVLNVKMKYFL